MKMLAWYFIGFGLPLAAIIGILPAIKIACGIALFLLLCYMADEVEGR